MRTSGQFLQSVVALMALTALVAGCGKDSRLAEVQGTYAGDFSRISNGRVESYRVTTTIDPVSTQNTRELRVEINEEKSGNSIASLTVSKNGDSVTLKTTLLSQNRDHAVLRDNGTCAFEESGLAHTTLCATSTVVSLFLSDQTGYRTLLYLTKGDPDSVPSAVTDGRYGLKDLFDRVRKTNYETRLGAEKLYQAREEARIQEAGLYPRMSVAALGGIVSGWMWAVNQIGNLAPFIFPSNWYNWEKSKAVSEAQLLSYRALIANQMNLVSDIFHNIHRDQIALARLEGQWKRLDTTRAIIAQQVDLGFASEIDLLEFKKLINQNETDQLALRTTLTQQHAILSRGVGLSPRSGIKALVSEALPDLASMQPLDAEEVLKLAPPAASLEIQQLLSMERAAQQQQGVVSWSFISASEWIGLNFGTAHQFQIAASQIREAQLMRAQAEKQIEEQVISMVALHNQLLERNRLLHEHSANQQRATRLLEEQYHLGKVSILQLRFAFEGMNEIEAKQVEIEAAMSVLLGKLDRLFLRGEYEKVLDESVRPGPPLLF